MGTMIYHGAGIWQTSPVTPTPTTLLDVAVTLDSEVSDIQTLPLSGGGAVYFLKSKQNSDSPANLPVQYLLREVWGHRVRVLGPSVVMPHAVSA